MLGSALIAAGGNILGGILSGNQADKRADKQAALQKEFAQHGIRWKVEDAKAAGLHPLAALGAQTTSYAPVAVGGSDLGTGLAQAGQDVSRAINATRTSPERVDAYTKTVQDLNIQRMGLENQLLGSQIAKINQTGTPPAMPVESDRYLIEGQGDGPILTKPMKREISDITGAQEAGAVTEQGFARTPYGWAPMFSRDTKDRLEEDLIGSIAWSIRNRLGPTLGFGYNPPSGVPLGPNEMWYYSPFRQEYQKWRP